MFENNFSLKLNVFSEKNVHCLKNEIFKKQIKTIKFGL